MVHARHVLTIASMLALGIFSACGGPPEPASAPSTEAPAPTEPAASSADAPAAETPAQPDEKIDVVDCKRIDDPAYREKVKASGVDPDSIDCGENDTGD